MATTRFTLGAVMSAVSESAATITNTMSTVNTAVSMANAFVTKSAKNQQIRYVVEEANSTDAICKEVAMEMIARDDAIKAYINGDVAKGKQFNQYLAELKALVTPAKP